MSKTKKIATAVISVVMAATMCASLAACGPKVPDLNPSQTKLDVSVDENGALSFTEGTNLNMNTGYNGAYGHIAYTATQVGNPFYMAGNTYTTGSMKPAWQALEDELGVSFTNVFTQKSATEQIQQVPDYPRFDMITGQADTIVQYATADNDLYIDLSLYLDQMPNYKAFLEENPLVMLSITSDTETGAMYYAPYFDGNDDIEKYEIANQHWVEYLLDSTSAGDSTTFASAVSSRKTGTISSDTIRGDVGNGTEASYTSFMGTTGSWWVETTDVDASDLDADGTLKDGVSTANTVKVVVNYDDALADANDESTALGAAVAAAGVTTDLTSGNIVDIQNAAINATDGAVTGAQLLNILREYIKVAYQTESGAQFYNTLSDVFNGYNAAWDVDLLVAFSRCLITNTSMLNTSTPSEDIYAIMGRQYTTQRMNDLTSLAGELFGVRGLAPRYQYTYIDSEGVMQDARNEVGMWEALDKMNEMVEEGLLYTGTTASGGNTSYYTANHATGFMVWDYVQTQTANGGYAKMGVTNPAYAAEITDDYNFAPISTPVSKWNDGDTADTDYDYTDDGEKYMRFTESWRSVKNTGFCLPYANYEGKPEKLSAALAVIDYMFSNDGQYLMTYGPMSSSNSYNEADSSTTTDGFWYATEVTNVNVEDVGVLVEGSDQYTVKPENAQDYFIYKNKVYTGTYYNGEQGPTLTTAMLQLYFGNAVTWTNAPSGSSTVQLAKGETSGFTINGANYVTSYTNFARGVIGSALPLCNKLQSFEYQCTADIGIIGADKVAANLVNGTISHVYLQVNNAKDNYWYTISPTTLPYASDISSAISSDFADNDSNLFSTDSKATDNILIDVIRFGLDGSGKCSGYDMTGTQLPTSAADMVTLINNTYGTITDGVGGMDRYEGYMQTAWSDLKDYYDNYIA